MRSGTRSFLAGVLLGIVVAGCVGMYSARSGQREETFGLLAWDLQSATEVGKLAPATRHVVSRSVDNDLHIVFMRYSSLTSDELHVLRLTQKRTAAGLIVLSDANARELWSRVSAS